MSDMKDCSRVSPTAIDAALRCLEVEQWKQLKGRIDEYKPHVIILIARRMPRIFEILTEGNIWDFPHALVVSDFAIPWIANAITPETRIAIIDDTICQGTTLANACRKIRSFGAEPKVFAIGIKEKTDLGNLHALLQTKPAYIEKFSNEEYQEFSYNTARAMSFLPKSYDSEFPVFNVDYVDENANVCFYELLYQFERNTSGKYRAHDTSVADTAQEELGRISLDMYPEQQCNYKLRIYLDDKARKAIVVPMATGYIKDFSAITISKAVYHGCRQKLSNILERFEPLASPKLPPLETFVGETQFRLEQFISSLEFGLDYIGLLEEFFDLKNMKINTFDANMLFGNDIADEMSRISLQKHMPCKASSTPLEGKDTSGLSPKMREVYTNDNFLELMNSAYLKTYEGIFIKFFSILSDLTQAENANGAPLTGKIAPSGEDIKKNPALRLRIGPTFNDMCIIFQELWHKVASVPQKFPMQKVRSLLSEMLDRHIDLGGVVPVIAMNGERVYRKGEAPSYDSNVLLAYEIWHNESPEKAKEFPLDSPWKLKAGDLPEKYQEALSRIDRGM